MPEFHFLKKKFTIPSKYLLILLFIAILLFFNLNDLIVRIYEINYWDEAQYIIRGRYLVQGDLPTFSWSPFTSTFFALLYLPFSAAGNWLPQVATIGRVIIYVLLFLSLYLISEELEVIPWPAAAFGIALVYPVMIPILKFQSDALFAVNSAFALWLVLRYRNSGAEKNLWLASMFSGFAALTRNDGLILFAAFLFIILFVIKQKNISITRKLAASITPFVVLVAGYLLIFAAVTGQFYVGTVERSWGAFVQGQYFIYPDDPACETNQLRCAVEKAEELYGTGEENNYSVLNAIRNNPQAFVDRLGRSLKKIPNMMYQAYGGRTAFSLIILGAFGLFELFRTKKKDLLIIFLLWISYLPVYLMTFFRAGYFYLPFYVFYALGLIGIFAVLRLFERKNFRLVFSVLLGALTIAGFVFDLTAMYLNSILLLLALWFGYWLTLNEPTDKRQAVMVIPLLMMLVAGVVLHGSFDPFVASSPVPAPEEEAIMVLFDRFPKNTPVAAGAPGAVVSAQMKFVPINGGDLTPADSTDELHQLLLQTGIEAIYVDHFLTGVNEYMWALIEPGIGTQYERIYMGDNGSIQVLKVVP